MRTSASYSTHDSRALFPLVTDLPSGNGTGTGDRRGGSGGTSYFSRKVNSCARTPDDSTNSAIAAFRPSIRPRNPSGIPSGPRPARAHTKSCANSSSRYFMVTCR